MLTLYIYIYIHTHIYVGTIVLSEPIIIEYFKAAHPVALLNNTVESYTRSTQHCIQRIRI